MNGHLEVALSGVFASLNIMGGGRDKEKTVVIVFSTTHRTLQQQFVSCVIIPILKHLADAHADGNVDLRNKKSAALASKMLAAVTDEDLFLPLI